MIEGLPRHCTDAEIEADYVDTHGASVVGFAFIALLNLRLPPGPKNIGIRVHRPDGTPPGRPALGRLADPGQEEGPAPVARDCHADAARTRRTGDRGSDAEAPGTDSPSKLPKTTPVPPRTPCSWKCRVSAR
ncbi:hypothetical protein GCM10010300_61870 [Streptomyces olivaceoviridis]|uniref:Tn3 family transposase n=1 Tax=Streptomyces olivaceoviridis TaxID=1921 RepID=UPI001993103E|nr:hypothetical protein GCM10010300_61870 [Streptomyces olivaceoviridis]